ASSKPLLLRSEAGATPVSRKPYWSSTVAPASEGVLYAILFFVYQLWKPRLYRASDEEPVSWDGSAWVVYEMVDGNMAIAPWPKEDGWDEALPPSVGVADETLGIYRGKDQVAVITFFGPRTVRTFATRDPQEFEGR
ncbi:MAG: hypothetical protein ABW190_03560, partial [Rhizobacter sp.]